MSITANAIDALSPLDGRYAAKLINPEHPKATLSDGDKVPERFASATVCRVDAVIRSIRSGPSLRIVVSPDDIDAMIDYAYWVARHRGRI